MNKGFFYGGLKDKETLELRMPLMLSRGMMTHRSHRENPATQPVSEHIKPGYSSCLCKEDRASDNALKWLRDLDGRAFPFSGSQCSVACGLKRA